MKQYYQEFNTRIGAIDGVKKQTRSISKEELGLIAGGATLPGYEHITKEAASSALKNNKTGGGAKMQRSPSEQEMRLIANGATLPGWEHITKDIASASLKGGKGDETYVRPTKEQIESTVPLILSRWPNMDDDSARALASDFAGKVMAKTKAGMQLDAAQAEAISELGAGVDPGKETGWFDLELDKPASYNPLGGRKADPDATEENIAYTAKTTGMTVEQVKERLRKEGRL